MKQIPVRLPTTVNYTTAALYVRAYTYDQIILQGCNIITAVYRQNISQPRNNNTGRRKIKQIILYFITFKLL